MLTISGDTSMIDNCTLTVGECILMVDGYTMMSTGSTRMVDGSTLVARLDGYIASTTRQLHRQHDSTVTSRHDQHRLCRAIASTTR
jgi:hypothetical protein